MSIAFTPWQIKSMPVKNRLVRSATWEGAATLQGNVTDKLIQYYHDLSVGGVGLIISGYMYVRPDGIGLSYQTGIYSDDQIGGLERLTQAAHHGDSRVICQIVHGGGQVSAHLLPEGAEALAPSSHYYARFKTDAREMTIDEINAIVSAFGDAAARAKEAGFDGVQLHGAHGYLINQFLSGHTNKRKDQYGGSLSGRFRFAKEVAETVRARVGEAYPVGVKLNSQDCVEGGLTPDEAVQLAQWFERSGIDFIEVSGGLPEAGKLSPTRAVEKGKTEAYFLENARRIKGAVSIPVICVGGWRTPALIDGAIGSEAIDAVAMSRPFIAEPDLALRWQRNDSASAKCISCNGCFAGGLKGEGIFCKQKAKGKW